MRFTIRELGLFILCVALALGWSADVWLEGRVARITNAATYKRLIDTLEVEIQRVANETGATVEIKLPGLSVTANPEKSNPN
jgi:hypothetical protein